MRPARSVGLLAATACLAVGAAPMPAAAATGSRSIVTTHLSASGFDEKVPVGSVVSVVQTCPAGSLLDKAETRGFSRELDGILEAEPNVRLIGRELWVAGLVARYRVVRRGGVPTADGFGVANVAVCTSRVRAGTTTVRGRASTDVRVWGPAPRGVRLFSFTGVRAVDAADAEEKPPFRTALRATGTAPSQGALAAAVRARQEADNEDGALVSTTGTTRRRVLPGQFASMRSNYAYTVDLTKREPAR